jgi:hypothetical protein
MGQLPFIPFGAHAPSEGGQRRRLLRILNPDRKTFAGSKSDQFWLGDIGL